MANKKGEGLLDVVFCHDDMLTFRGQKHEIGLDEDWKKVVPAFGDVYAYWRHEPGAFTVDGDKVTEFCSLGEYDSKTDQEKVTWNPTRARVCDLGNGVHLHGEGSYLDVRMLDLWENFGSRYRVSLDALVDSVDRGVIGYKPRAISKAVVRMRTPQERKTEAMRVRFRDRFKAVKYEHNLIMPRDIGDMMLKELRGYDMAKGDHANTVYLKGYNSTESMLVKVYDQKEIHGDDSIKIEVTFRKDYLERHNMRDPAVWETQPKIQEKISDALVKEWKLVFDKATGARDMLAERVKTGKTDLYKFMASTRNTFTEVKARLEAVEVEQARAREERAKILERLNKLEGNPL